MWEPEGNFASGDNYLPSQNPSVYPHSSCPVATNTYISFHDWQIPLSTIWPVANKYRNLRFKIREKEFPDQPMPSQDQIAQAHLRPPQSSDNCILKKT